MDFSHLDTKGNAKMVDVGEKKITFRKASATGLISMSSACYSKLKEGSFEKGDVLPAARIAGVMALKKTSEIIPLCHPLSVTGCQIDFVFQDNEYAVEAVCTVSCSGKTGVEMEALTGVSAALLTIYDMCKSADKKMLISNIHLLEKHGGRSGDFYFEKDKTT